MSSWAGGIDKFDCLLFYGTLETRHEAQRWLAARGVPVNYSLADLEQDRKNLEELLGRE